ncbi:replication protein [Gorillibacterium timonense]|uniref:replication protein n=1 Tax=Gorillibacterium timonense TaxID=1689269 RepID=UPI00131EA6B2|nr:replication protein [Gorillibacterium timonense]
MASSRHRGGFIGIANQVWDEVLRRDFSKRQKDILMFLWRLSYGCNQEVAIVPLLKDFSFCGVGKTNITSELAYLEQCKVIQWDRENNQFRFESNFEIWELIQVRKWDDDRFSELIHLNLKNSKQTPAKVIELITDHHNPELSKQEPKQEGEVIKTITETEKRLLKQEPMVIETRTETTGFPSQDAASEPLKDILKTVKIKDINICSSAFAEFWNIYPRKIGKQDALKTFQKRVKEGEDPQAIIQCAKHYREECERLRTEPQYVKHAKTFLNGERYKDYLEGGITSEKGKGFRSMAAGSEGESEYAFLDRTDPCSRITRSGDGVF